MSQHGPPDDYRHEDDCVMSNFDGSIDRNLEQRLRQEKVVLDYAGHSFHGEVWFDHDERLFRCCISVRGRARETVSCPTLDEIMEYVCLEYGND